MLSLCKTVGYGGTWVGAFGDTWNGSPPLPGYVCAGYGEALVELGLGAPRTKRFEFKIQTFHMSRYDMAGSANGTKPARMSRPPHARFETQAPRATPQPKPTRGGVLCIFPQPTPHTPRSNRFLLNTNHAMVFLLR
ncbi:hypothetical protein Hanom_Chr07g00675901 [Helianthus anomalus]